MARRGPRPGAARDAAAPAGREAVVLELAEALREALDDARVEPMGLAAVGVGAPGSIDVETGTVIQVANIEGGMRHSRSAPRLPRSSGGP